MKNTDIFNDYDMVVSVTEKTLNDQMSHLVRLGVIHPELVLYQSVQKGEYVYEVFDSGDQIPRDADGTPWGACIDGALLPTVSIAESGTNITFVLNFRSGTAWFWQGNGPLAQLVSYDMTGWTYGVIITLDLKTVEKDDIGKKINVPDLVKQQLHDFTDAMFTVNHLFMDFESTDLLRFDPASSSAGSSGDVGLQQLVLFMEFYLKDLIKSGNPYILGYSLTTGDQTQYPENQQVPDALRPVGTTYSMYNDPTSADRSNLNFVLVTKGGQGSGILGTPGNFDTNWIAPGEQCDAKMIYSHTRLLEQFILQPFYDSLSTQVFTQLQGNIDVPQGNAYAAGRATTATGLSYTISDVGTGDDQYVNTFTVDFVNGTGQVDLNFTGSIRLYKEISKSMGFCTADAWASGSVDWSGTVSLAAAKDAQGNPTLDITRSFKIDNSTSDSDKNKCAEAFEWIGKILGTILDVLSAGLSFGFFEKLFDDLMDLQIPGIGDVSLALGNLGNTVSTVVMLPAGQVFFFKNPSADPEANLALELVYKSETAPAPAPGQAEPAASTRTAVRTAPFALPSVLAPVAERAAAAPPAGQSVIDNVALAGTGPLAGKEVSVQVSCELMTNQQPAAPLDPTRDTLVAYDAAGQPMVFSIGTDRKLYLMRLDAAHPSGWSVTDLTAGFTGYTAATAFDLAQDRKGRISLVAALSRDGAAGTDLFAAPLLSNDAARTDWTHLSTLCRKVDGIDPAFAAERIRMGSSDDGPAPLTVAAGSIGEQKYYYQVTDFAQPAVKLEFPENVSPEGDALMDLSLGYAFGQRGVWFLYRVGDTETLECTTLADSGGGSLSYDYSPGNASLPPALRSLRYNCLATPTGTGTDPFTISSDVYVGTDSGIYLFRGASAGSLQKVADGLPDVHQLVVRDDGKNISVWAMCSPNQLYYVTGTRGAQYTWNAPILFSAGALHVAPIRSPARGANELFVIGQDGGVTHWWQDPGSTLWQQRVQRAPQGGALLSFDSFTTHLHLEDADATPLAGRTVRITASEWTYATANGTLYSLDRDAPAQVPTDGMGNVTVVQMAGGIHAPILHVEADCFAETLNVYPNGKVLRGLQAVQSGADLQNARTQDGKPVLDGGYDADTLDGVASNVSQLTGASGQYITGSRPTGTVFVSVDAPGVKHDGVLRADSIPDGFAVGMQLSNGRWRPHTAASLAALPAAPSSLAALSVAGGFGDILDWAGDALHWVETAFEDGIKLVEKGVTFLKDGVSFVIRKVEDGLQFVLQIAGKVLNIALKTLGSVFKALNWVLKLVGIDLGKILAWLGHLFGWDDIWDTHKVIASVMRGALDYAVQQAETEIESWRASLDGTLSGVGDRIRALAPPAASVRGTVDGVRRGTPSGNLNSPPANFSFYQMQHGGMLSGGAAAAIASSNPFDDFVDRVLVPAATAMGDALQKDVQDLLRLFQDPSSALQNAVALAADLVDTVLVPVRAVVDGLLVFLEETLKLVRDLLADTVDIPFLSDFYSWVTDLLGEEEDLTVINAVALLLAIPATLVCKAVTRHAPFADGTYGMDDPGFFQRMLGNGSAPLALAAAGPARALVAEDRGGTAAPAPHALFEAADDASGDGGAASGYSRIGGMLGAVASVGAGVAGFFSIGQGEAAGGAMNTADKVALGFSACQAACTVPLQRHDQPDDAYGLKMTAFGIATVYSAIAWKLPNSSQVRGGTLAGVDALLLVLALIADGLGKDDAATWCVDIFSNVGGIVQGAAQAAGQKEVAVVGAGVAYLGGSLPALIVALTADSDDIVQFVNVGG